MKEKLKVKLEEKIKIKTQFKMSGEWAIMETKCNDQIIGQI